MSELTVGQELIKLYIQFFSGDIVGSHDEDCTIYLEIPYSLIQSFMHGHFSHLGDEEAWEEFYTIESEVRDLLKNKMGELLPEEDEMPDGLNYDAAMMDPESER